MTGDLHDIKDSPVACDALFIRSNVARYLDDSLSTAGTTGPEHESVPGVSGRSNGLARSEWGGGGLVQEKFSCARTTHFHSLSADLSVDQQEETVKAAQTTQSTGRDVTAIKVTAKKKENMRSCQQIAPAVITTLSYVIIYT